MASYKLTNKAVRDLKQIWNYTWDNWSESQADLYYSELINHCSSLANNPALGRKYENLLSGLRGSKVNKHIVFYRQVFQGKIEVVRILHERMDLESNFMAR